MARLTAAADGSALGNPGPAGWAWYVDEARWRAGGWPRATNNRGELMAVIDLVEATAATGEALEILCDSQYVINAVTKWMPNWKRRGWRKSDGSPVLNRDLLERLDTALAGRDYTFTWVKGHAGHPLNEAADRRARAVATAYQDGGEIPVGPGLGEGTGLGAGAAPARPTASAADAGHAGDAGSAAARHADGPEPFDFSALTADAAPEAARDAAPARAADGAPGSGAGDAVAAAVRAFVAGTPGTVSSTGADGVLHSGATGIDRAGRRRDARRMLAARAAEPAASRIEDLDVDLLDDRTALALFRTREGGRVTEHGSLWVHDGGRWMLRFHQETPLA